MGIGGVHALMFSPDPEAVRRFLADVLELPAVDAGGGWLIFALPPAELGVHPTDGAAHHELYLMCSDLAATMEALAAKGVEFAGPSRQERFGTVASLRLPDGQTLALYEPNHRTAVELGP